MPVPVTAAECANTLLSRLPEEEYQMLRPHLDYFPTPLKTVLFERGKEMRYAYFPLSGAHSVLAVMEDGATVEVGTVGYEGMSTVDLLTGSTHATETTICQIPGASLRLTVEKFHELLGRAKEFRRLCFRFLQAYLKQVSQSVACNRLHSTEERFARWILVSQDRARSATFQLTQEFLADMLGVHRPRISLIARNFQQAGLLTYNRGVLTILDRTGIEEASCECYAAVKQQFENALRVPEG